MKHISFSYLFHIGHFHLTPRDLASWGGFGPKNLGGSLRVLCERSGKVKVSSCLVSKVSRSVSHGPWLMAVSALSTYALKVLRLGLKRTLLLPRALGRRDMTRIEMFARQRLTAPKVQVQVQVQVTT